MRDLKALEAFHQQLEEETTLLPVNTDQALANKAQSNASHITNAMQNLQLNQNPNLSQPNIPSTSQGVTNIEPMQVIDHR